MNDLYDSDFVLWSERQAALLRRMGNRERVNGQVDWGNVAESKAWAATRQARNPQPTSAVVAPYRARSCR